MGAGRKVDRKLEEQKLKETVDSTQGSRTCGKMVQSQFPKWGVGGTETTVLPQGGGSGLPTLLLGKKRLLLP